jgi:hypothetical protein
MTKFVVDCGAVLHLASEGIEVPDERKLLAPTLLRSQTLSALHEAVNAGELPARRRARAAPPRRVRATRRIREPPTDTEIERGLREPTVVEASLRRPSSPWPLSCLARPY